MILLGTCLLVFGVAILFNPAILGYLIGFFLILTGSWIILGWYRVNRVLEKKFAVGKYHVVFSRRDQK